MRRNVLFIVLSIMVLCIYGEIQLGNKASGILRYEYRIINRLDTPQDVVFYLSLPQTNERQEVHFLYPEPGYAKIVNDSYGNPIAIYREKGLQPGEVRTHGWMASVTMKAAAFEPLAKEVTLKPGERKRYLLDRENYLIHSPAIKKLQKEIVPSSGSDYQKALAIFFYLITNIDYYRDDRWDTAPEVLERGQGSCSEYNYAFISLLRASGIPARYTGGFVLKTSNRTRYDDLTYEDAVFHRWTEVFLPNYGWTPFDASRGSGSVKRFDNCFNYVARIPSGTLQTYRGDGGKGSLVGWDYVSHAKGLTENSIRDISVFYYINTSPGRLRPELKKITAAVKSGLSGESLAAITSDPLKREILFFQKNFWKPEMLPGLIPALIRAKHPSAVYFSIYALHKKIKIPEFLRFPFLCDQYLQDQISAALERNKWNWQKFEYWWRKARTDISYSPESKKFILHNKNINIY